MALRHCGCCCCSHKYDTGQLAHKWPRSATLAQPNDDRLMLIVGLGAHKAEPFCAPLDSSGRPFTSLARSITWRVKFSTVVRRAQVFFSPLLFTRKRGRGGEKNSLVLRTFQRALPASEVNAIAIGFGASERALVAVPINQAQTHTRTGFRASARTCITNYAPAHNQLLSFHLRQLNVNRITHSNEQTNRLTGGRTGEPGDRRCRCRPQPAVKILALLACSLISSLWIFRPLEKGWHTHANRRAPSRRYQSHD